MFNLSSVKLGPIPKVLLINAPWGLAILIGSIIQQSSNDFSDNKLLFLWGVVTVVGLLGQALGLCKGLEMNFVIWVVLIALAWVYTFLAVKVNQDLGFELFAVWLGLMGIGFVATAIQVDKLFWIVAILHFVAAIVLELAVRDILKVDFLQMNIILIFGIVMGGLMLVAAIVGTIQALRPSAS